MVKTKKLVFVGVLVVLILWLLFCLSGITVAKADTCETPETKEIVTDDAEARGLAANLSLAIGGGDGIVWADVKNEFTLFPSVIWVYVELYSSDTYQESYVTMTLEARDSIKDLDMGNTIKVMASTGGEQKYWQARMRYKFDERDWISKTTPTFLYSAEGIFIE